MLRENNKVPLSEASSAATKLKVPLSETSSEATKLKVPLTVN